MAEEITDLTEEEVSAKPGKEKKAKEPKAQKEKKTKEAKDAKEPKETHKKKGGKLKIILFIVLAVVLIIAIAVAMLIFNLFGARDIVGEYVYEPIVAVAVWFNPELNDIEQQLRQAHERRVQVLDTRETGQNMREEELLTREEDVALWETALERRGIALDRREEQLNAQIEAALIPMFRRVLSEQEREEMESLARTYAQMAPADAARILEELPEPVDAAAVLFFMVERNAGAIMAAMDPELAAEITLLMLEG